MAQAFVLWAVFLYVCLPDSYGQLSLVVLFAALSSCWTYLLLQYLGYFQVLRPKPRKSDLFLVFLAVPLVVLAVSTITLFSSPTVSFPLFDILLFTPILALCIFFTDYLMALYFLRAHIRRKVVVDLLPLESIAFIKRLGQMGCAAHLEFLNRSQLEEYVKMEREREIDLIIISRAAAEKFDADGVMIRAHLAGISIQDHRQATVELFGRVRLEEADLWSYILNARAQTLSLRLYAAIKVLCEPILAGVLLAVFSPLFLLVAVVSKCVSRGPVFYTQKRMGYLGKTFTLIKFRTMNEDAEQDGVQWSQLNDRRITPFGRFLRKTRLDELPQLWNVLRGEMSFVGPRPERPEICEQLRGSISLFPMRTIIRPGITGWAQIHAGYAASVEESRIKLEYDLFYIQHTSPRLDLIVLIKTILTALEGIFRDDVARVSLEAPFLVNRGKIALGGTS